MKGLAFLVFFLVMGSLVGAASCQFDMGGGFGKDHLTMVVGAQRDVGIIWTTTDNWNDSNPQTPYLAGSQDPQDNFIWGLNRIGIRPVSGGYQTVSPFRITAPKTPGHYSARFGIVHENVAWIADTDCGPLDINVVSPNLSIINVHAIGNPSVNLPNAALLNVVVKNTGSTELTVDNSSLLTVWGRLESETDLTFLGSVSIWNEVNQGNFVPGSEQTFTIPVDDFLVFMDQTAIVEARLTTQEDSEEGLALPVSVPGIPVGEAVSEDVSGNDFRTFVLVKQGTTVVVDDSLPFGGVMLVALLAGGLLFMNSQKRTTHQS